MLYLFAYSCALATVWWLVSGDRNSEGGRGGGERERERDFVVTVLQ